MLKITMVWLEMFKNTDSRSMNSPTVVSLGFKKHEKMTMNCPVGTGSGVVVGGGGIVVEAGDAVAVVGAIVVEFVEGAPVVSSGVSVVDE
jgi:predicted ATP-grasp superfamily ATP-dependent carboligase